MKVNDFLTEAREVLVQEKLPYARDALEPVMSKDSVDLHYGKLSKGYVDRYNNKEGDDKFNYGGAHLHNLFWLHLQPPAAGNNPSGKSLELIERKFGSYDDFKEKFIEKGKGLQGSGWVYMDINGNIDTIPNQDFKPGTDIIMLVDMWEHSYLLDKTKDQYLSEIWRIVNWDVVNIRLNR